MTLPIATVVAVRANRATVEVEAAAVCARCAAGKGCGAGLVGPARNPGRLDVAVDARLALVAGERVYLSLEPANIVKATLVAYGLPMLGLVIATGIAPALNWPLSDLHAVAAGLGGLAAGFLLGRRQLRREDCLRRFVPTIRHRVVPDPLPSG